jgi:hypothetical protein
VVDRNLERGVPHVLDACGGGGDGGGQCPAVRIAAPENTHAVHRGLRGSGIDRLSTGEPHRRAGHRPCRVCGGELAVGDARPAGQQVEPMLGDVGQFRHPRVLASQGECGFEGTPQGVFITGEQPGY